GKGGNDIKRGCVGFDTPSTYLHSFAELCFINRLRTIMLNLKMKQNVYRQRKLRQVDGTTVEETN
ncbi:hypothetical protein, partial [uncultured Parabacteroides sp.]|uniref:hypothetical protein n=1 Tax=uncultured Parabacteroides sp. TaxID=512312 RepID=UPI0025D13500